MSGLRKLRHRRPVRRDDKERRPAPGLNNMLLIFGLGMLFVGGWSGAHSWQVYQVGRRERVAETPWGSVHLEAVEAGDPGRRTAALVGFAAAGIGFAVCLVPLTALFLDKVDRRLRGPEPSAEPPDDS